ncbi:hypothetical protein FQR65_LT06823 [Abscondita terminalis]|nr:hypothetical protein FQR65_LT06823 [Abscondita terminalis]
MNKVTLNILFFGLVLVQVKTTKYDAKDLQCLICKATINELNDSVKKIDPARKVDVGGYRIDSRGNSKQKVVSEAKSEVHLSELADKVCDKMDDYVRATWKENGKLTLLKLIVDGQMNPDSSLVDFIQDDDLNKSLKYYCEGFVDEHEDSIIEHFKSDPEDIVTNICYEETKLCVHTESRDEIILTRQLQHPNIITYFASFVNGSDVCVVSPLMAFGSCKDLLDRHFNHGFPEQAITLIIREVLEGLDYIHRKGFIHRAIRASHILISETGRVCLSGLRYACPIIVQGKWQKYIHSFPANASRNLSWLSPEVLEQNLQGYNEKSDIYSIGVVFCELANGVEPFAGMPTTLMLIEKVRGAAPQLLDCSTIPRDESNDIQGFPYNQINRRFSEALHQLAALCLQRDPFNRPTAAQLCSHSYLKLNRRGLHLPDLLKPALPLSERVAQNTDELANLDNKISNLELSTCEWDF